MLYFFNGLMNSKITVTVITLVVIGIAVLLTLALIVKLFKVIFCKNTEINGLTTELVKVDNEEIMWTEEEVEVPVTVYKTVRVKTRR